MHLKVSVFYHIHENFGITNSAVANLLYNERFLVPPVFQVCCKSRCNDRLSFWTFVHVTYAGSFRRFARLKDRRFTGFVASTLPAMSFAASYSVHKTTVFWILGSASKSDFQHSDINTHEYTHQIFYAVYASLEPWIGNMHLMSTTCHRHQTHLFLVLGTGLFNPKLTISMELIACL